MRLKLAEDRVFQGQLRNVFCEREEDEVVGVILHSDKRTLDEAYREAQRLAREWGFDEESLNQWYARARSGNGQSDERFENFRNDLNPTLGLRVLRSFNDLQPWYVSFEVRWPRST